MRYHALDSLRGVAAVTVLFAHLFVVFPEALSHIDLSSGSAWQSPATWFRYTPLRVFIGGRPAVILFFVLSGFVLAIPFLNRGRVEYVPYLIKRIFRIYVPFSVSIALAAVLFVIFGGYTTESLSHWFLEDSWNQQLTSKMVINHLIMTGTKQYMSLNNVMWSLVHELRISMIYPYIFLLLRCSKLKLSIAAIAAAYLVSKVCIILFGENQIVLSWLESLGYVVFFAIGALLAINMNILVKLLSKIKNRSRVILFCISIVALSIPAGAPGSELVFGFASAFLIIYALISDWWAYFLNMWPLRFLGKISFSLYLFHLPIVLVVFRLGGSYQWPMGWSVVVSVLMALLVSIIAYALVERPSIWAGRTLAARLMRNREISFRSSRPA